MARFAITVTREPYTGVGIPPTDIYFSHERLDALQYKMHNITDRYPSEEYFYTRKRNFRADEKEKQQKQSV